MAGKKIKITAKATIKRAVHVERRIQYKSPQIIYTQSQPVISTAPIQKALGSLNSQVKSAQHQLQASNRRTMIPSGVYSRPIEDLFYSLSEQRKPEDVESKAMYDVFISHASEDKKSFVDPLVKKLQDAGIRVWYDTLEMEWGKSLREQIDIRQISTVLMIFARRWN